MYDDFDTLIISSPAACVLHVQINRPAKVNAMDAKFWVEFRQCFQLIAEDTAVRAVVVSGIGEVAPCLRLIDWLPRAGIGINEAGERVRIRRIVERLGILGTGHALCRIFKPPRLLCTCVTYGGMYT